MSAQNMSATTRRRFIQAAAAAGLGAGTVSGLAATSAGGSEAPAAASGLADAVLQAFNTHRLVGVGEIHGLQTHGDALTLLLADPRLPDVVDDIVVEFGNALYQNTIDRFIAGQPVADADLRHVWRNTVVSPLDTYDEPMYEQVYRTIRAANWGCRRTSGSGYCWATCRSTGPRPQPLVSGWPRSRPETTTSHRW